MSQYGEDKKEELDPFVVIDELAGFPEPGRLSFELRVVGPAVKSPLKAAIVVQRSKPSVNSQTLTLHLTLSRQSGHC